MKTIVLDNFSRRSTLIEVLRERGAREGVEIGTDHGQYAEQLARGIPGLYLTCVDPWTAYKEGNITHSQEEMNNIYAEAYGRLHPYDCDLMRTTSMSAVGDFAYNRLDFVFIDGNHDYEHVLADVSEWTKRVKPGGIVCGHDYKEDKINGYGVIEAVNKYVEEHRISPLFILRGGGKLIDCWMFFKQP